jgi:hypothetical protein
MPPRKKQKTLRDFTLVLSTISNLYEEKGDVGRSRSFSTASTNLCAFADVTNKKLDAPLKSSEDFKDVKGVGKSTLEMLDEFIKTGTCSRLDELEETKQVKLVDKTPKTTKKAEKEKLKCGVGIFREIAVKYDEGDYMFAYIKSDKTCLHEDIGEYYLDTCEYEESEYPDDTPEDLLDTWSTSYAGLMYWDTHIPEGKFAFVREATEDDMKREDYGGLWKGDGLKSQSLILPTSDVAEDEVTREELRDLVKKVRSCDSFPETHVDALKELYEEEQEFIEKAKSSIVSAMKLFPYEDKGYNFHGDGFNLIWSKVQFKEVGDNTITIIEIYGDHEEAELLFMCGNKSMTARLCRYSCESEPDIRYKGDEEEIRELFGDELSDDEDEEDEDDEDEVRNFVIESFLERYDLCYVPE